MPGRFGVLLHGSYPTDVPTSVIAEALGFTGPEDVLVFVSHERLAPGEREPIADPGEPLADPVGRAPLAPPEGVSLRTIQSAPDLASDAQAVSTLTSAVKRERWAAPLSAEEVDAERAAAKHRQAMQMTAATHLGIRLPDDARGVTFLDIQSVAHALHATAELLPGHEIMLRGRMGERYCRSFSEACRCLNSRTFQPEALYG